MTTVTTDNKAPSKTYLDYRAATKPGWVFAIVGLVSPAVGCGVYAFKQRSWAYVKIWLGLFAAGFVIAMASPENEIGKGTKYATHLAAGGVAALVASNHKKKARKELGLDD